MGRDSFAKQSLGVLHGKIKKSRVLMVGAGGIGCELLKNLVLTGFGEIHIVDLDTIDLSNLNRQFLFRHEHIKKSKAIVAKETAAKFNPHIKLEAHHSNIKDHQFNLDWFQRFDLVFNALDNLDARRHVNRMCLAANVPLIESGTTGFNGQVQVIVKGKTECYDCNPKETPKSFPVCTIRSTPSQPIHCIVWAKSYLFTEIFGTSEDESQEFDYTEDSENAKEIENLQQEAQALKMIRQSMGSADFPRKIFEKVFKDDIERLRSMEDMWNTRKSPESLDFDELSSKTKDINTSVAQQDQVVWSVAENFAVFIDSLRRVASKSKKGQAHGGDNGPPAILTFDKDDDDTLDFVAASANLRSIIFGIELRSKFDIKQMAGNIIPAIATTNAMTAALCVLQAFKVLRNDLSKSRMVFLERSAARVINTDTLQRPNPDCSVCGVAQSRLVIDPIRATLSNLVEDVLKLQLGYGEEFSVNNEIGTLYDPDLDDNLPKKFSDLGIKADSFLTIIDDDEENPRVNLSLSILEQSLPEDSLPVSLPQELDVPLKPKNIKESLSKRDAESAGLNGVGNGVNGASAKRKRPADDAELDQPTASKKGRIREALSNRDDIVVLDDSGNGAIMIDDD